MKAALQILAKYHPMIKFIGGPHPIPSKCDMITTFSKIY